MVKKILNKSKSKASNRHMIKILKETNVPYVNLELDMDDKTRELLIQYAKNNILKDEDALLNWAFTDALKNFVDNKGETK